MPEIDVDIQGLGLILYSPPAVAHIAEGADYFQDHFARPADVARQVMDGQLTFAEWLPTQPRTAFGTGSPGSFHLRVSVGQPDDSRVQAAEFKLRLGLQVRSGVVCVRDLYDLIHWSAECPSSQQFSVADGWYRLTVFTSPSPSGLLGDGQQIDVVMEPVSSKPALRWNGVPSFCG